MNIEKINFNYRKIKNTIEKTETLYKKVICRLDQITPKILPKKWSVDYALTITLRPVIYSKPYEQQYEETYQNILNLFHDCKLTLVTELTQSYNIHYHGIVSVPLTHGRDSRKYIFDQVRKYSKLGSTKVDQITDFAGWSEYILKDVSTHIDNDVIYPIIKDDYNIYDYRKRIL